MMIQVNVQKLIESIKETDAFQMPKMNSGTKYLYDGVYSRLSQSEDVRLSELDFDAFDLHDIDSLNDLHENVFERNSYAAGGIMSTLQKTTPICRTVCYV